jgi:hypothetical protein
LICYALILAVYVCCKTLDISAKEPLFQSIAKRSN